MPSTDIVKLATKARRKRYRLKQRVLSYYSDGTPACACCGEKRIEFLAIDHVDGGGNLQRKSLGLRTGEHFYSYLAQQGYPAGYRVLCHNCNCALGWYGYCPHTSPECAAETDAMLLPQKTGRPRIA